MSSLPSAFSTSYQQARQTFLDMALAAGLAVQSPRIRYPVGTVNCWPWMWCGTGRKTPAICGSSAARHGVEGYCGSGVQIHALRDTAWQQAAREQAMHAMHQAVHDLSAEGVT